MRTLNLGRLGITISSLILVALAGPREWQVWLGWGMVGGVGASLLAELLGTRVVHIAWTTRTLVAQGFLLAAGFVSALLTNEAWTLGIVAAQIPLIIERTLAYITSEGHRDRGAS